MGKAEKLYKIANLRNVRKVTNLFKNYGFSEGIDIFAKKLRNVFNYSLKSQSKVYKEWFLKNSPSKEEIKEQTKTKFKYSPLISIIVPTYNTPIRYLKDMITSVINQSYSNWELCIADGSENHTVCDFIKENFHKDKRIKFTKLNSNEGISNNTNEAIKLAKGDYLAFLDHDDIIAPNALFEVVLSLQDIKHDLIYTDEDFVSDNLKKHKNPFFKPDWSPFLLRSHNYITHFLIVNKKLADKVGYFNKEFDGAQDYDFVLRCIEKAKSIHHIPKVLYHWRMAKTSVAASSNNKIYAYDAGKRAIQEHLKRLDISADVESLDFPGHYHVHYNVDEQPLVSIIIPNKDQISYLDTCINSIYQLSSYKNFEIIIVENNSEDVATFDFYKKIQKEYNNIKVVKYDGKFNYSAINNYGVQHSKGEYLLFLNNDTKLIEPDSIKEMLALCSQNTVGCVGAKLLYDDNTLQHAGVIVGFAGSAVHPFHAQSESSLFYRNRPHIICDYSAVTAACLMTSKKVFNEVKGFTESFEVALNDVDYCLKLRDKRYSVVFNPKSLWYHFESKSRGYENTPEKKSRFQNEVEKLQVFWPKYFDDGDEFYNLNLSLNFVPYKLQPDLNTIDYEIDSIRLFDREGVKFCQVTGWATTSSQNVLDFKVICEKNEINIDLKRINRPDLIVKKIVKDKNNDSGFELVFPWKNKNCVIEIIDGFTKSKIKITKRNTSHISFINEIDSSYERWYKKHKASNKELLNQKETVFKYNPKFSFIVPLYNTPKKYLDLLIASIQKQSYPNWELCFSDGSGSASGLTKVLEQYSRKDKRIKYIPSHHEKNIAENTNCSIDISTGDFLVFVDHDDVIEPNALYECVDALNKDNSIEFIYSDEDKIDLNNKHHFMPHFKSDFNLDMLRSINYICHMLVVKKSLQEKVGKFNSEYDGAQDYDFILRCIEKTDKIYHIPKILYNWRSHPGSTAFSGSSKTYTVEASIKALNNHYKRSSINAKVEVDHNGFFRTKYALTNYPKLSIIIPNKDHKTDLEKCITSLLKNNTYKNFEIIVVENNSSEDEIFKYYKKLNQLENVNVVSWKGKGFNYSSLNNYGSEFASGDYLLFLNNDTEILYEDSIEEMLAFCIRDDVGAVGCKLFFGDGTIQHAGVIVGILGIAGHQFANYEHNELGYFGRTSMVQDLSAVTAACMMVDKKVFEDVGKFNEDLAVAFNDIDLCLRIRKADKLIVYTPYAQMIHYESKSRGYEDSPEKSRRFKSEKLIFRNNWKFILDKGDPYYNNNLSLEDVNYNLDNRR